MTYAEDILRDLLAVIFRDGGQRTDSFACLRDAGREAQREVVRLLAIADAAEGDDA